jgi:hypothetical protein
MSDIQVRPTTNLLIPSDFYDALLYWGDQLKKGSWAIGDIANQLYEIAIANKFETTKLDICHAVGRVVGKSGRTIRLYATTAAFYNDEARAKYGEILPFSHFAFATRFQQDWDRVLDVSMDCMDEYGIPPSVERLAAICGETSPDYHLPPVPEFRDVVELPPVRVDFLGEVEIVESSVVSEYRRIRGEIKSHLFPMTGLLEKLVDAGDVLLAREVAAALTTLRRVEERLENLIQE